MYIDETVRGLRADMKKSVKLLLILFVISHCLPGLSEHSYDKRPGKAGLLEKLRPLILLGFCTQIRPGYSPQPAVPEKQTQEKPDEQAELEKVLKSAATAPSESFDKVAASSKDSKPTMPDGDSQKTEKKPKDDKTNRGVDVSPKIAKIIEANECLDCHGPDTDKQFFDGNGNIIGGSKSKISQVLSEKLTPRGMKSVVRRLKKNLSEKDKKAIAIWAKQI